VIRPDGPGPPIRAGSIRGSTTSCCSPRRPRSSWHASPPAPTIPTASVRRTRRRPGPRGHRRAPAPGHSDRRDRHDRSDRERRRSTGSPDLTHRSQTRPQELSATTHARRRVRRALWTRSGQLAAPGPRREQRSVPSPRLRHPVL